ncbi:MAG: dephospho-CoA kinase [Firmicutes bacterium]|nr:dephospho-CoA kinase [Bacillota bacterium]
MKKQKIKVYVNFDNYCHTFLVGLTGGIGAGKSTVAQILKGKGAYIIDTDEVSRRVMVEGMGCYQKLIEAFPSCVVDGVLQRSLLKNLVFSDENSRKLLNFITHPYILAAVAEEVKGRDWVVVQVPLLFESGFYGVCDVTLGILANEKIRIERVLRRDGMTEQLAAAIIKTQYTDEFLREKCDFCIENNGDGEQLRDNVNEFYRKIEKRIALGSVPPYKEIRDGLCGKGRTKRGDGDS